MCFNILKLALVYGEKDFFVLIYFYYFDIIIYLWKEVWPSFGIKLNPVFKSDWLQLADLFWRVRYSNAINVFAHEILLTLVGGIKGEGF